MSLWPSAFALVALAAPHALALERVRPVVAVSMWSGALALRAVACVYAALFVILYLPGTAAFAVVSHWCWHGVLPLAMTHLKINGHDLGDAAMLAPASLLVLSLAWGWFGLVRTKRAVRNMVAARRIGDGPGGSLIVGDQQILLGVAGLRRPQVIVSAGALLALEDDELAAGLAHERGHIARHHRPIFVAAEIFGGVARFLPGTRHAQAELLYHLERDADEYALSRHHHPASLAGAICKAAESALGPPAPALALGGGDIVRRLHALLDGPRRESAGPGPALFVLCLVVVTATAATGLPAAAYAGVEVAMNTGAAHACPT